MANDIYTQFFHFSGVGTATATTAPATLRAYSFTQKNVSSNTDILCGGTRIFRNFAVSIPYSEVSYFCQDGITIAKTGNDEAQVMLSLSVGDIHAPSVPASTTINIAGIGTSTPPTQGDMLNAFFLFVILSVILFSGAYKHATARKRFYHA